MHKNNNGLVKVTVLWEFIDEQNRWIPYSSLVCAHLERSVQRSINTNLFLGDIEHHLSKYSISLLRTGSAIQINSETGTRRAVRRLFCSIDHLLASGISWLWFDRQTSNWKRYNFYVQEKIEQAFRKGDNSIDIQAYSFALPYVVHFRPHTMQKHKTSGKARAVRRTSGKPYPTTRVPEDLVSDATSGLPDSTPSPAEPDPTPANSVATTSSSIDHVEEPPKSRGRGGARSKQTIRGGLPGPSANLTPDSATGSSKPIVVAPRPARRRKQKSKVVVVPERDPEDTNDTPPDFDKTTQFFQRYTVRPCDSNLTDDCIICMESLSSPSPYSNSLDIAILVKCRHPFHRSCLEALLMSTTSGQYIQCPLCKQIHGVKLGDQPTGTMSHFVLPKPVPGYEDCGTICIVYSFEAGIQGPQHPKPGKHYQARGFPRYCYLPNSDLGKKVLRLLIVAWQRRLTFTIGQSVTTGQEDTVTWNEIHHKTEQGSNYSGHGYPDPNYLNNVQYELAAQGVTDEDLSLK